MENINMKLKKVHCGKGYEKARDDILVVCKCIFVFFNRKVVLRF